jgi:hypothetical protein
MLPRRSPRSPGGRATLWGSSGRRRWILPVCRGAAKFGGTPFSVAAAVEPSTDASKWRQLIGRIASRSGTPHAENRTNALIPRDPVQSPRGRRRAAGLQSSTAFARERGTRLGSPLKRQLPRGFARSGRLTEEGRLIDSKGRKRLKKRGVRRSLQSSSKRPVVSCVARPGHRKSEARDSSGREWEVAWRLEPGSGPSPPPEVRSAVESRDAERLQRLRRGCGISPALAVQSRHSPCRGIDWSHGEGGGVNRERAS